MTTKDQELKALAQIKKIVAGLGENSYVATAFEGCFEIAEDNIGNDWGCSMKQRAESAEESTQGWIARFDSMKEKRDELQKENEKLRECVERNAKTRLTGEEINGIQLIMLKRIEALDRSIESFESTILEFADAPEDIAFRQAVSDRKAAKAEREKLWALNTRLDDIG